VRGTRVPLRLNVVREPGLAVKILDGQVGSDAKQLPRVAQHAGLGGGAWAALIKCSPPQSRSVTGFFF
jgi:hypothetical protein